MTTPRLLSDRYELGETLGYGGMSEVHAGRDVRLGRDVAVKVLRADLARDPQFQLRFRREAQNAAALNHPAIVAVYDTGETRTEYGPLPYIVMEYVDGRTLRDIVKTEGPMPPRRAMEVMADVCAALDFSHRNGIIHRDVKPANVMITRNGAVKVMDFGIARALADGQNVTQTAAVIGTAQYLSPEQARGEPVDARSDVYATGCVLFEMLTGEPPFTGDSPVAVAYQHVREDVRSPSSVNPRVNPVLDAIVLRAMSKNPANRYQSAGEMRADLVRVLSGQRPSAPQVMTDEDRTTILGATNATHMMQGRHRPESLGDDMDDDRGTNKGVIAAIALLAVGLLVLGALLIANVFGSDPPADTITMPALVGQHRTAAEAQLAELGLKAEFVEVPSEVDQVDKVISTEPGSGQQVPQGSTVKLNIGKGPEVVQVPDLTGKTIDEAKALLEQAQLQLASTQEQQDVDDENLVGKVIAQDPAAGAEAAVSTPVRLTIGTAPEQATVINVVGQDKDTAKSNLESLGFVVNLVDVDSIEDKDDVVAQDPKAGTKLKKGATVTLSVSRGNQIEMPDIEGLSQQQAEQRLRERGWTGLFDVSQTGTTDPNEHNRIVRQDPDAGQPLSKDQTVRIQIAKLGIPPTTTEGGG
jgi:beta-lactam-binding protein with PASTA domain/predicted Ser/Thr protein kinase